MSPRLLTLWCLPSATIVPPPSVRSALKPAMAGRSS